MLVVAAAASHPGRAIVGVKHGDPIPQYLLAAGLISILPRLPTRSPFRLEGSGGRTRGATLVDRSELEGSRR